MSDQEHNGVQTLSFSLKRKEIPLQLEMDDGTWRNFKLVELTGKDRDAHVQFMVTKMRMSADGKASTIKNAEGIQADLISRCLVDEEGHVVPIAIIQKWPASVSNELYKACIDLCGLNKEAEEAAKNE